MAEKLTVGELVYKISGDMENLKTELKKAETEVSNLKSAMEKSTTSTKAMGKQTESTALSVLKGATAYKLLEKGVSLVTDFLKESITASLEASRIQAQIKTNVENAGLSYEKYADSIQKASKASQALGFDDDKAGESLSRFLLITKDMTQSQGLLSLAMDLSRAKNMSLESATQVLLLATQGQTKGLKDLGVKMEDTDNIGTVLAKTFDAVGGSALSSAKTPQGQLEIQKQKWEDIQKEIGNKLVPTLTKFYRLVNDNQPEINDTVSFLGESIVKITWLLGKLVDLTKGTYQSLKTIFYGLSVGFIEVGGDFSRLLSVIGLSSDKITGWFDKIENKVIDLTKKAYNATKETSDRFKGDVKAVDETLQKAGETTEQYKERLLTMGKSSTATAEELAKVKTALKSIGGESQAGQQAIDDANKALKDFQNTMLSTIEKAKSLRESLEKDLGDTFKKFSDSIKETSQNTIETLGKLVVDAQSKISDLRTQLSKETDNDKRVELEKEIAGQQSILDARIGFEQRQAEVIKGIKKQLADANIDSDKIGLDSMFATKTLEQQIEEDKKNATLNEFQLFEQQQNQKLQSLTTALITEVKLLSEKITKEKQYETELTSYLQSEQSKRLKNTDTWAKDMIQRYGAIADSLRNLQSLQAQIGQLNTNVTTPAVATSSAVIPQNISNATTSNKIINAPININATTTSPMDWTVLAHEMGWQISQH